MAKKLKINEKMSGVISYKSLISHILFFTLGVAITFLLQNLIGREILTLSTLDIINIIFSVALSGAGIVLAIVAINLAKESEKILIDRSEASIKFQSDLFIKTSDVLTKIESSTGITEKRLEDLISGKAGKAAQDLLPDSKVAGSISRKELEKSIKSSLLNRASSVTYEEYDTFHKNVLSQISNIPNIEILKKGQGRFGLSGEKLVDGVFNLEKTKFSVSAFFSKDIFAHESIEKYIISLAQELKNGEFDLSFLVFESELAEDSSYLISLKKQLEILTNKIRKKIIIQYGSPVEISKKIHKKIEKPIKK